MTNDIKAALYWIARNYQQSFYEIRSDWNSYKLDEHSYLKNFIHSALYGPPSLSNSDNVFTSNSQDMKLINLIYEKIVMHGTQETEDKEVLCGLVHICGYNENNLSNSDMNEPDKLIDVRTIFKVKKQKKSNSFENWYVDDAARVYQGWSDFLKNNTLPFTVMIVPKDGFYQPDFREIWSEEMSSVLIEHHDNEHNKKVIKSLDTINTFGALGTSCILIASAFIPVAAPVLLTGTIGAAACAAWSGGRAVGQLLDRKTHDQSINITNRESLLCWLGVTTSVLGAAASGSSALLTRAARTGTSVSKSAQIVHDVIQIGSLANSTVGIAHTSYYLFKDYNETGKVSTIEVLFVTAQFMFLCNSLIKHKVAVDIIESNQKEILTDYENSLRSNRHKKAFQKLMRNTADVIPDTVNCNEEIIRSITKIDNKDEFFAKIVQNTKALNKSKTKLSFANGQIKIDETKLINSKTFASMSKKEILNFVTEQSNNDFHNTGTSRNYNTAETISDIRNDACIFTSISNAYSNLRDLGNQSNFQDELRNSAYIIVRLYMLYRNAQQYSQEDLIRNAAEFIWSYIKRKYVVANITDDNTAQNFIDQILTRFYNMIRENLNELLENFHGFLASNSDNNTNQTNSLSNITIVDPLKIINLEEGKLTRLIMLALLSTGSRFSKNCTISEDMINFYSFELNEFCNNHGILLNFKFSDLLYNIRNFLLDLNVFEKKNIIFYKIIVIAVNFSKEITNGDSITKDLLESIVDFLWIILNVNFYEITPNTVFSTDHESLIMELIIHLYNHHLNNTEKWCNSFSEYKNKLN